MRSEGGLSSNKGKGSFRCKVRWKTRRREVIQEKKKESRCLLPAPREIDSEAISGGASGSYRGGKKGDARDGGGGTAR